MTRRTPWIAGLGVALAVGIAALVLVAIHRLAFFRIRSVEVVGVHHLDERAIVAGLGIPADADILVPLDPIARAAHSLPGVREARATRRWPGTLRLVIREAPAVAFTIDSGRVTVLDDRAHALPVLPARLEAPLPIIARDSIVAAVLARLQATDPAWFRHVDRATAEGRDVVLVAGAQRVRVAADLGSEVFINLAAVRDRLDSLQIAWREIDARFHGRMFVRKEAA